jgi:hypothetical protein
MSQTGHPQCANLACPTPCYWKMGGRFFHFRLGAPHPLAIDGNSNLHSDWRAVEYFWLCKRCSLLFTLVSIEGQYVVLQDFSRELTASSSLEPESARAA